MKKLFFALLLLSGMSLSAQKLATIEGMIYNASNKTALAGASFIETTTGTGIAADANGYFKLQLPPGLYNFKASAVGYQDFIQYEIGLNIGRSVVLDFFLNEKKTELSTVEIQSEAFRYTKESPTSIQTFNIHEVERMPGATLDVSKFIKTLPGVSPKVAFGYSTIIRGGASNENRYYLDGIEIPNITHFTVQGTSGGPNGLINSRTLQGAQLHTGAFPAARPNALSSVLELTQREGRRDRFGGNFTLGATDYGFMLEGPMGKKMSYLFSARESFSQHYLKAIGLPVLPTYSDVQFKHVTHFNEKNELTLLALAGYDKYLLNVDSKRRTPSLLYNIGYIPEGKQLQYTAGANFKHYQQNGYWSLVASRSFLYNYAEKYFDNQHIASSLWWKYRATDTEDKIRFEQKLFLPVGEVQWGVNIEKDDYTARDTQSVSFAQGLFIGNATGLRFARYGGFASFAKTFNEKLDLFAGLRFDGSTLNVQTNNPFQQFSPRLSVGYRLRPDWRLSASAGIYYQLPPSLLLTYSANVLNSNRDRLTYMQNTQFTTGVEHNNARGYQIKIEGFYKKYANYPFLLTDSLSFANANAAYALIGRDDATSTSNGQAYGVEFQLKQKLHKSFFWGISYTYLVSQFEDKQGKLVSSAWDNRNYASVSVGKTFKNGWQIGASYAYSGGNPYTPYKVAASALKENWENLHRGIFDYNALNTLRLAAYHVVNLRVDKRFNFKKWSMNCFMDVANATAYKIANLPYLTTERDASEKPLTNPNDPSRYLVQEIKSDTGRAIPTIGVVMDF
jgi:TonB dependent receptor/CarboxypepD_reg-like domain/TonB-dependent Receptor Plug Domain